VHQRNSAFDQLRHRRILENSREVCAPSQGNQPSECRWLSKLELLYRDNLRLVCGFIRRQDLFSFDKTDVTAPFKARHFYAR
jgi:hypothetical protein